MTFGIIFCKITNKLIVAQMTKSALPYVDIAFLAPVMMFLNQLSGPLIVEINLLNMILAFLVVDYFAYCHKICQDICDISGVEASGSSDFLGTGIGTEHLTGGRDEHKEAAVIFIV